MKQTITMDELQKELINTLTEKYPDTCIMPDVNGSGNPCIAVKPFKTASPTAVISLERMYDDILHGRSLDSVKDELTSILGDLLEFTVQISAESDFSWEDIKGRIRAKLVNKRAVQPERISIPIDGLDVATVFDIRYDRFSTAVTPKLLERWGVDIETIKETAETNTTFDHKPVCRYLTDIVEPADIGDMSEKQASASVVVTNIDSAWGANAILRPDVQSKVKHMLGGEDYYIAPSSVHETICVPKSIVDLPDLLETVRQTNRAVVALADQLSDDVWDIDSSGMLISAVKNGATA